MPESNLYQDMQNMIFEALADTQLIATVDSAVGATVYVKFPGNDIVQGPFQAAAGVAAAVSVGDPVKLERVRGQYIVAYIIEV